MGEGKDTTGRRQDDEPSALITAKNETLTTLREQLQAERQAHTEARGLLAATLEWIPATGVPQEAPEGTETVEEAPEGTGHRSTAGGVQDELDTERNRREVSETTLHEGMAEERGRREAAERGRDGLRRELFALRGREEAYEAAEQQGKGQQIGTDPYPQRGTQPRPWRRRMFGR